MKALPWGLNKPYLLVFYLVWIVLLSDVSKAQDALSHFYLQQKKFYQTQGDGLPPEEKRSILNEVAKEITRFPNSAYAKGARFWVAQEYSTLGDVDTAIDHFEVLVQDQESSPAGRQMAQLELGLAYSRKERFSDAERVWLELANDPHVNHRLKQTAVDKVRVVRMRQGKWKEVAEIVEYQLQNDLGSKPVLLESAARAARRSGDYEPAEKYYRQLLAEHPQYRSRNRMLYIEKAAVSSRYHDVRTHIDYLREMEQASRLFAEEAAQADTYYAEVYQEYSNMAQLYLGVPGAYKQRNQLSPLSEQEAQRKALGLFMDAIEGVKQLPEELRKNIEFDSVVQGSYMTAAQLLVLMEKTDTARQLLEEYLRLYANDLDSDRLLAGQRMLHTLMWGNYEPDILDALPAKEAIRHILADDPALSESSLQTARAETTGISNSLNVVTDSSPRVHQSSVDNSKITSPWMMATAVVGILLAIGAVFYYRQRSRRTLS